MSTIKFSLPFRAISVNDSYYGNRKFGMKKEAKEWTYAVNWELAKHSSQFESLKNQFNPKIHGLSVSFLFIYKEFFNKSGSISSKIYDLTNCEKLLLDLIVDSAHHGPAPYKSPNLNINDKHVIELISRKTSGSADEIVVEIKIIEL